MTPTDVTPTRRYPVHKRLLDVVVASAALIGAIPVTVVVSMVLALQLRTSPLFVQDRVGRHGRTFRFPKLRTLDHRVVPRYALKDQVDLEVASRLAGVARRTKIDELPQLLLVLRGTMSLVGPRPRMPDRWEPVENSYRRMREAVPQGCTGLWQISVHADMVPSAHPEYDALYVTHASVRFDLWIMWRTLRVALGGRRITLDDIPLSVLRDRGTRLHFNPAVVLQADASHTL